MDDVLDLIGTTKAQDEYGVMRETAVPRRVFCQTSSITRAEFFDAGRNGLNPEIVFTVFNGDYRGERTIRYHGDGYAVYRTYIVPGSDYIELYAQREGGTNGANETDG